MPESADISFHELATMTPEARAGLTRRAEADLDGFLEKVRPIIDAVRDEGDAALARFARAFDKSPVEPDGINPLFPAVSEHHFTLGAGARVVAGLGFDAAVEYSPRNTVSSNAQNQMALQPGTTTPSGYSFDVAMSQLTLHLGARYLFD